MPSNYDRDEITFQYPENWVLREDPKQGFPRLILVTATSGAFWSLTVFHQEEASLAELSRQYEEALSSEYDEVECDDIEIELPVGRLAAIEFSFYCLDFLVRSRLIATKLGSRHVLIACQAEDREFDEKEPVFLAMTFSLLSAAKAS